MFYCGYLGRATLSGVMGMIGAVTSGAAALRDAAVESFEGGESHTYHRDVNGDSDDEV
jgi:hypothetical protein